MLDTKIDLLRLQLTVCNSSAPHNNFTLNTKHKYNITVCSLYEPKVLLPSNVKFFNGNGKICDFITLIKRLISNSSYDLVHAHTVHVGVLFIIVSFIANRKLLKKSVFTVHNSYENYHFRNKILFHFVYMFFNKIIYCSKSSLKSFPNYLNKQTKKNIVIRNGVDVKGIAKIKSNKYKGNNSTFNIIVVGRLVKIKQPLKINAAFELLKKKDIKLIFIGEGPLRYKIMQKKCDQVVLKGEMARDDVYRELYNSDLYISMATTEGMPMAVLESMASGLPVILSDIDSHRELVQYLENIDLIPIQSNPIYLKDKIQKYINMYSAELQQLGELNRKHVIKNFSIKKMLDNYDRVYNEVIEYA